MNRRTRRRYELRNADLNEAIETLVTQAQGVYGDEVDAEYARQILVTSLRLIKDKTTRGDMKLINSALKELRHALHVFGAYDTVRKVAVFGSARTPPEHQDWKSAHEFAQRIVDHGWMVITGAGDGIMGAAQGGAGREQSFGVNIRLPFEQSANPVIAGDRKLINFRYFFTRKVMFVKESHAIALFPGGFG
ncbi:MAG: LOG family protein, partial [Planctomycetota bacterium]